MLRIQQAMVIICFLLCVVAGGLRVCGAQASLQAGFAHPPQSAKPQTWWHWMNANESREGIRADLEAMKQAGLGGAEIFNVDLGLPSGKVPFMSPQWRKIIVYAAEQAKRLGLELCIHNCAGWSSSGGPWITPDKSMQVLVWSQLNIQGPAHISGPLPAAIDRRGFSPRGRTMLNHYHDVAVLAFRTPAAEVANPNSAIVIQDIARKADFTDNAGALKLSFPATPSGVAIEQDGIVNLTDRLQADGRLDWEVPDGQWTILRMGHAPTGADNSPAPAEGRGLECDKLSRSAMDLHWSGMLAKVLSDLGPLAPSALNDVLIDSYEVGAQNWTPLFREEFRRRRGYDPILYLPVVTGRVVDSMAVSERFLWDLRRTVADLYADNYYGYLAELCHKHGLKFSTEPYYSGMYDNLQIGGLPDIPMGEFWIGGAASETTKLAASAGHTNGKRIIGAESFTAGPDPVGPWQSHPYSMKALGDSIFCNGVNRYIFHRYAHQPWMNIQPGMNMGPFGTQLERTITWWKQAAAWFTYISRCQFMLQSGRFVADVCYLYGENAPNDFPPNWKQAMGLPSGYDFDGCDGTALQKMTVQDHWIVLPTGMRYRLLVLPNVPYMTPQALRMVKQLLAAGATIIGPKPEMSPSLSGYPQCDADVNQLAGEIWGNCDGKTVTSHVVGKGRMVWGVPVANVLAGLGAPADFKQADGTESGALRFIHRTDRGAEIYFVSNQRYRHETIDCSFRVTGKIPELWHPASGLTETAPVYRQTNGRTIVTLRFDPAGSVFVLFRKPSSAVSRAADHLVSVTHAAPGGKPNATPKLEILRAFYGTADELRGANVTAQVAELVARGEYAVSADNGMFGDPVPNVVKRLTVTYRLNGKAATQTVSENQTVQFMPMAEDTAPAEYDLAISSNGVARLTPWQPGIYKVRTAGGRAFSLSAPVPDNRPVSGPWVLQFPPNLGAPAQVQLDKLVSWPDFPNPGVRYFSGTATYRLHFTLPSSMFGPGRVLQLDLGRVKDFAEVTLNGHSIGVLWKPPFRTDVTGMVKPGLNTLSVSVTNMWPNRLIGDEQLPPDTRYRGDGIIAEWPQFLVDGSPRPKTGRVAFTTYHFYKKDSPLFESGLLGPVVVRSAKSVVVR